MILAQEMRPDTFEGVIGNDAVVQILQRQIRDGTLSQSIMITGDTGTGKTTLAHIIAKAINAEVVEIDCGSEGGIDSIRALIDSSNYTSLFATNKVYILDEVHKLTNSGQSALLRTLEEPRSNVHFILLTNEPEKVLRTLRTRCVVHQTSRPGNAEIGVAVRRVLDAYDLTVEDMRDFWAVINQAEGSLRQVYSLLEKLVASSDENGFVSSEAFKAALGEGLSLNDGEETSLAKLFIEKSSLKKVLAETRELSKNHSTGAYSALLGIYNYLRVVESSKPESQQRRDLMIDLTSILSDPHSVSWMHVEHLAWKYL